LFSLRAMPYIDARCRNQREINRMSRLAARISPAQQQKLLLEILPDQGAWTEDDYLWLTDHSQRLIEFSLRDSPNARSPAEP
jgi:hypothetical protein